MGRWPAIRKVWGILVGRGEKFYPPQGKIQFRVSSGDARGKNAA